MCQESWMVLIFYHFLCVVPRFGNLKSCICCQTWYQFVGHTLRFPMTSHSFSLCVSMQCKRCCGEGRNVWKGVSLGFLAMFSICGMSLNVMCSPKVQGQFGEVFILCSVTGPVTYQFATECVNMTCKTQNSCSCCITLICIETCNMKKRP